MQQLPPPEIVRCFFETRFTPHLAAMELRWDSDAPGAAEQAWHLPDSLCLRGPAPERFGVTLYRRGPDRYELRVLWNRLCLTWEDLSRSEIMASSLALLLGALGTDLWHLLDQPVAAEAA